MIAVDTSAVIAILLDEPEASRFAATMTSTYCSMPIATALECHIVARRQGEGAIGKLETLISSLGLKIVPLNSTTHLTAARDAFDRYGKGRHRAALNFGDCLVYGFAKAEGLPLLFKGNDFAQTDIESA